MHQKNGFMQSQGAIVLRCQTEVKQKSASSSLESCFFSSRFFQHAIKDAKHMVCRVLILGTKFFFPSEERWKWLEPLLRRKEQPTTSLRTENLWTCFAICEIRLVLVASVLRDSWVWMSPDAWVPVNDRFCLQKSAREMVYSWHM